MQVSIRQVAEKAGVSRATVSRVLNGNTEAMVAPATRDRIRQVAHQLGYHPNAVARGLAGKPMNTIGVIMAYQLPSVTSDPFLGQALDGILEICKQRRQKTVLFAEDDWDAALTNVPIYCDGHCDGLIVVIPRVGACIVPALYNSSRPIVLLGDSPVETSVTSVDSDNSGMAREAVSQLIAQGHRRIAIFCGNADLRSNDQRMLGYEQALNAAGLSFDSSLVYPGQYWEWSGVQNMERLLKTPRETWPTALFCSNGRIAIGALTYLQEHNYPIPETISISALMENPDINDRSLPRVSGVRMPIRRAGEYAVKALLDQIHEGAEPGTQFLIPGEPIDGDTIRTLGDN